jgi:uncharacterized protein (TIGR02246 family)
MATSPAERAVRDTDAAFSRAGAAKDLERVVAYFASDGSLLPPNLPPAQGKEAIHSVWSQLLASSGFAVSWQPTKVEVSQAEDLGYTVGTYELTMHDANGSPVTDRGKYVTVWKKQADGTWKVAADMFNSDLQVPAMAAR